MTHDLLRKPRLYFAMGFVFVSLAVRVSAEEPTKTEPRPTHKPVPAAGDLHRVRMSERSSEQENDARSATVKAPAGDSSKEIVVLTVWVVSMSDSPEHGKEGSKSNVAWRLQNLPSEFASLNDVRSLLNDLKDSDRLRSVRELRLVALDGQVTRVQAGLDKPQIMGSNYTNFGRTNTVNYRSLGTIVDVSPRIDAKKDIQVEMNYNKSDMDKSNDVPLMETKEGKSQFADQISTYQFKTVVKLKSGSAVVVGKDSTSGSPVKTSGGQTELIILGGVIGTGGQSAN